MPMIIINTQDIECTIRQELTDDIINPQLTAQALIDQIIACGDQTPAEKPIERVQEVLQRHGILRYEPNAFGRLVGELVRACLGLDSPQHDKPVSAGECPTDES